MLHRKLTACAVALALGLPITAAANDSAELEKIRAELQQLRESYEGRIQALETQLQQAGLTAARAEQSARRAEDTAQQAAARPAAANAFNPATSVILDGKYARRDDLDERHLTGFLPTSHEHGGERGFSLNHSELAFSASVDSWLRGQALLAVLDEEIEVEEAFFETQALGYGLTLKGGRFRSGIGYQNELHGHAWDFADNSLMYQALFGEGHTQDGVQLKWVAPTELLLELGGEVGRGAEINAYDGNGAGTVSLFAHAGGDIGTAHAWRAGLSWLKARSDAREFEGHDLDDVELTGEFDGDSRVWIADFVYKWAPNGNATRTSFKLQGEYFRRSENGTLSCAAADGGPSDCDALGNTGRYRSDQSGWYAQGIYQFMPRWRVGLRYDRLNRGDVDWNGADIGATIASLADFDPRRSSAMLDFSPSEFSRFRLQYARDESMPGQQEDQWTLQYIMSLGAHGAHRF